MMKRRALKLIVLLLAGAIINVAVAWGCAGFVECSDALQNSRPMRLNPGHYLLTWQSSFGITVARREYKTSMPFDSAVDLPAIPWYIAPAQLTDEYLTRNDHYAGWPLKSLTCWSIGKRVSGGLAPHALQTTTQRGPRCLPYSILWPGFAINTIFYAAIIWMLFAVPGAVRRRLRHKRGQCASCGYSLRENTSEKCPECGASV